MSTKDLERVAYLVGAGATHASAMSENSPYGLLMNDLANPIRKALGDLGVNVGADPSLKSLINSLVSDPSIIEHIITFLDQSVSQIHREFAERLREAFVVALNKVLEDVERESGGKPNSLYSALIDMHFVQGNNEQLNGVLTLNYDDYIESALLDRLQLDVDYGLRIVTQEHSVQKVPVLKLHGSFSWREVWPVELDPSPKPLWIPPGVHKPKGRYPFNLIWGRAREILDCDVLRIIGCNLSANDWDLVSLLFSTNQTRTSCLPYRIEIIDHPGNAERIKKEFSYLPISSIFDVDVGDSVAWEVLAGKIDQPFSKLQTKRQGELVEGLEHSNWFRIWLIQKSIEVMEKSASLETEAGEFQRFCEEVA